jgi:ParB family chromosome partitioning protein
MELSTNSLRDRKLRGAARLLSSMPTSDLMGDLVDTVQDQLLLDQIKPNPHQPRRRIDEDSPEFEDLVGSIRQHGLIQPIAVWQTSEDDYVIIAGERRWRAYRRLAEDRPGDFARIPASVTRLLGDNPEAKALMLALLENVVRKDLGEGERADAVARLKTSTGWTYEQIADRMGLAVSRVQALAAIARHDAVKEAVNEGRITQKQALAIAQGIGPEETALASELVDAVADLPPKQARAVVREARRSPDHLSAGERVRQASAAVEAGAGKTDARSIILEETSLRVVRPQLRAMHREHLAAMLQRVCEETDLWPEPGHGSGRRTDPAL